MTTVITLLKMIGLLTAITSALFLIAGTLFLNVYPSFGGKPSSVQRKHFTDLDHYRNGKFINQIPSEMNMSISTYINLLSDYLQGDPDRAPKLAVPVEKINSLDFTSKPDSLTRLTWFGHSAIFLETAGKTLFLDFMLGPSPAPHPWLGSKRYSETLPLTIDQLPPLDAVILSHDHYDHLDYGSILQIREKVQAFYVPLGVGAHLRAWGVDEARIHELDWWEEVRHGDLRLVCTPVRHFSGRGLFDQATTLWASWVIASPYTNVYFSGDSGYGPHFKEIGERYGPFDLALMECGQYDTRWEAIHILPEQTAQAFTEVQGKVLVPIYWGAFTLALHSWTDPVERLSAQARERNISLATPRIGEPLVLPLHSIPTHAWWEGLSRAQSPSKQELF